MWTPHHKMLAHVPAIQFEHDNKDVELVIAISNGIKVDTEEA